MWYQTCESGGSVTGSHFLFALMKTYEQEGDHYLYFKTYFESNEVRWHYLLNTLSYWWQQMALFSISKESLLCQGAQLLFVFQLAMKFLFCSYVICVEFTFPQCNFSWCQAKSKGKKEMVDIRTCDHSQATGVIKSIDEGCVGLIRSFTCPTVPLQWNKKKSWCY